MDTKELLLAFSAVTGVAGREGDAASFAAERLRPYGEVEITPLGSVLCAVRPPRPGGPHLLLDAHMDEIGMVVTHVDETGFLRVAAIGGVDRRLLAAAPVTVHAAEGPLTGVVCSTPPHLAGEEDKKNRKVDEIYIDVGLPGEEAGKAVAPGDVVTLIPHSRPLLGDLVTGKALDDRAGCAALIKALEYLGDTPLDCGLTVLFSTMEEVGGQGARTGAFRTDPTHAVAVDAGFALTPDEKKEKCGELRQGPMIGFAPILNRAMSERLAAVAEEQGIPCQRDVMGGKTGTNADHIAASRGGVRTALLSVPLKYMHTPIETVAVGDVEHTGRLIAAYIQAEWGAN